MIPTQRYLFLLLTFFSLSACRSTIGIAHGDLLSDSTSHGTLAIRTELYFGMSKPGGGEVSEGEWKDFLDSVITPHFPDGLSVFEARGQWRETTGRIVGERTKLLLLLHPSGDEINRAIEEIRAEYVRRFSQEAVMRVTGYVRVRF